MEKLTLKELAIPMIKAIDSFNYLLKSHHRKVAVISYNIAKELNLKDEEILELVIAASLHDIGALSVQERDMLVQEDVINPGPHCIVGHCMLSSFEAFNNIAQIIKHHHIKYEDSLNMKDEKVFFASHIIHLADRIDVIVSPDEFILNQKERVTETIRKKVGTLFHPKVFDAFEKVSKADIFWIEIPNMKIEQLFKKLNFSMDFELTIDNVLNFALTISHIIDYRSKFTATHSTTVAHLAALLGKYFDFSDERCKKLMIAGYLHDIGKIGIDPGLIEKKGYLTSEEFNLVKLHPYFTGQILSELSSSKWFEEIIHWAERHHEKRNKTGYPYALDLSELDDGVRILAFSDIITALMEKRPYRDSLSIDESFKIIEEKLSEDISSEMFEVIKQHKDEINTLVLECQAKNKTKLCSEGN
ncbi:HD domain-containing phosphohydrolase [Halarcobacter sp.]|uniref:HD-GYP domain-containing protein n=1 Tax=Halarcobacter sp. TaxID=2321133 RepID=UPI002AAAC2F8|nr:HD domain-containing phosphohydrolase [Halarcobacter sp.]